MAVNEHSYYISTRSGNLRSYDSRLGRNATALCTFIKHHISKPPRVRLHCLGESTIVTESTDDDGEIEYNYHTYKRFWFSVDLTPHLISTDEPPIWIKANEDPTFRGNWVHQIEEVQQDLEDPGQRRRKRKATEGEREQRRAQKVLQHHAGAPSWGNFPGSRSNGPPIIAGLDSEASFQELQDAIYLDPDVVQRLQPSQKTLEDWAEEYCQSWKPLKEFRFRKEVYGWNLTKFEDEVSKILKANSTADACTAWVIVDQRDVVIRNGFLWSALKHRWIVLVTWITLIYPLFIWPLKRYLFGGQWKVAGSSYAFQRWIHLNTSYPGETPQEYCDRPEPEFSDMALRSLETTPVLKATSRGISQLVGTRWEDALTELKHHIANQASGGYIE